MIITCPSCKRKYRLDDKLVKDPYQKMRCSKCGHVFVYENSTSEETPTESGMVEVPFGQETEEPKKSHKGLWIGIISILVLAAIAVGLYFYWQNYLGAGNRWLSIRKAEGQEIITKDGKAFFINGIVANGSTKSRKYVTLKAKLFDREAKVVGEQDAVAGMALDKDEIQDMRKAELEKRVSDFRLSRIETFTLDKHKEMSFSILFFDDFGNAKEFTVEIIEAPVL